jgi:hypothetical protein
MSYITTDGQLASLSWNKAPIRGLRPDFLLMSDNCGPVDVFYNVQYICILHTILRYSFTKLV